MAPEILAAVSIEEFWRLGRRWPTAELVAGQIVEMTPPGARHGALASTIVWHLHQYVTARGLGTVFSETGFALSEDPPTVRAPDAAVVLAARIPRPLPVKFFPGAPDLAVEVLSPDDRPAEVAAKMADYLRAGTLAVWVVDPEQRTLTVHTAAGAARYGEAETLRGAPPFPEFALPLGDLFA
jgi:Uma2 family endonuclease